MNNDQWFVDYLREAIGRIGSEDKKTLFLGFVLPIVINNITPRPSKADEEAILDFVFSLLRGESWREQVKWLAGRLHDA